MLNQETIINALKSVKYPGYSRDIVSFGLVKSVAASDGAVSVSVELTSANGDVAAQLKQSCEQVIRALPGVKFAHVEVKMPASPPGAPAAAPGVWANPQKVPGLARIVAVA